jgi:hypothetical protein
MSKIVTGDDVDVLVRLYRADKSRPALETATEIKARLVNERRESALTPIYTCLLTHPEADWSVGDVIVPVLGSDTLKLLKQYAYWEVQAVVDGRKTTFLGSERVEIVIGLVP